MLQRAWHLPVRNLAIGMPVTCGIVALATHRRHRPRLDGELPRRRAAVADRPGAQLVGRDEPARAAPDPPLAEPRERAQRRARAGAGAGARGGAEPRRPGLHLVDASSCRTSGSASLFGVGCALIASVLLPREGIPDHQRALYGLGVAFLTYGVTDAAAARQRRHRRVRRADRARHPAARHPRSTSRRAREDIVEIVKLGVFVVFGSLLTFDGLFERRLGRRRRSSSSRCWSRGRSRSGWRSPGPGPTRRRRRSSPGSGPRAWRR